MGSPLNAVFKPVEKVVNAIDSGIRRGWRAFIDGPFQDFLFVLILFFRGK